MKGKSVILAGGSGGLGASVAESLAQRGAVPIVGCRNNRDRADTLARRIGDTYGVTVPVVAGDILESDVRRQLIAEAQRAGTLYGLVPLVGSPARVPIETATEGDFLDAD